MFTYAYTILAIIVVVFLIAKLKLTTELSMLASACAAALCASTMPATVSWSLMARQVSPRSLARKTTCDGASTPSEAVVWIWRSA